MPYSLFISYTSKDRLLAEEINKQLINVFKGKVKTFISSKHLNPGENWIDKIKTNLSSFDGIISLITPDSINKQWIFVEWSAFWLENKDIYVFLLDNSLSEKLIDPIKQTQYIIVNNNDDVERLFKVLAEKSKTSPIPYDMLEDYLSGINNAIDKQNENYNEYCLEHLSSLQLNDDEKLNLARYCVENKKYSSLKDVLSKIRSDYLKTNLVNELIDTGNINIIGYIYDEIRGSQNQTEIIINLIDNNFEDINIYKKLIDSIYSKDQTQLYNIASYLIDNKKETGTLFSYVIDKTDNMAEMRKIACHLVDKNKKNTDIFRNILDKFRDRNRVELRKVGEHILKSTNKDDMEFHYVLNILKEKNKEQYNSLYKLANK